MGFNWRKKATSKEKKEVAIILGAVFLVAIVGLVTNYMAESRVDNFVGAAINPNAPTYPGFLKLLRDDCAPVLGNGTCKMICGGEGFCFPVENDCDVSLVGNTCLCCKLP